MSDALKLREFELQVVGARPLTINVVAKSHRHAWAQHTKEVRRLWWALAREARIPKLEKAGITVVPLHVNNKSTQDVGACCPEAKAALDGLVDAGVLDDDSPQYVRWLHFEPPRICGVDGMLLRITEVA